MVVNIPCPWCGSPAQSLRHAVLHGCCWELNSVLKWEVHIYFCLSWLGGCQSGLLALTSVPVCRCMLPGGCFSVAPPEVGPLCVCIRGDRGFFPQSCFPPLKCTQSSFLGCSYCDWQLKLGLKTSSEPRRPDGGPVVGSEHPLLPSSCVMFEKCI